MAKDERGRPTKYTEELADKICEAVATSHLGMKKLMALHDWMPNRETINRWRWRNDDFCGRFRKAKQQQAELLAEQTLEIADDSGEDRDEDGKARNELVNRSRLRVDTRKWIAETLQPKIYGKAALIEEAAKQTEKLQAEIDQLKNHLNDKHAKDF